MRILILVLMMTGMLMAVECESFWCDYENYKKVKLADFGIEAMKCYEKAESAEKSQHRASYALYAVAGNMYGMTGDWESSANAYEKAAGLADAFKLNSDKFWTGAINSLASFLETSIKSKNIGDKESFIKNVNKLTMMIKYHPNNISKERLDYLMTIKNNIVRK